MARFSLTKQQQNAAPTVGDDLTNKTYVDAAVATTPTGIINPAATTLQQALAAIEQYIQNFEEKTEQHHHDGRYVTLNTDQTVYGVKKLDSAQLTVQLQNASVVLHDYSNNIQILEAGSYETFLPVVPFTGMWFLFKNVDTVPKQIGRNGVNINGVAADYWLMPGEGAEFVYSATYGWEVIQSTASAVTVTANGIIVPSATNVQNALAQVESYVQNLEERFEQHHHDDRYYKAAGAGLYNSGNFSHNSSGSWLNLTFDSELWDLDGMHSTGSNTERLTATIAGKYTFSGSAYIAGNANGVRAIRIIKTTLAGAASYYGYAETNPVTGDVTAMSTSAILDLAVGDYVSLQFFQNSGGTLAITGGAPTSVAGAMQFASILVVPK